MSDGIIIVGIGVTEDLAKHWAQAYHREMLASSRDFVNSHKKSRRLYDEPAGDLIKTIIC
jgi:hypothetical protein